MLGEILLKNMLNFLKPFKNGIFPSASYLKQLANIEKELIKFEERNDQKNDLKILMSSFSIHPPCFIHDRILSYALRLRGATIIPLYCDSIQTIECNFYGGVWKGTTFDECCSHCCNCSELLWRNNPIKLLQLSKYINMDERLKINKKIANLDNDWPDYHEGPFIFGKWAKDILVNNHVVGDYHLIPNYDELGKNHVHNLLLLESAYRNLIRSIVPDRVVTNDSFYGMWAILQKICDDEKIPFYSHWMGTRPNAWCYAHNDASMNLDFSKPWKSFASIPLTQNQNNKVKEWIDSRPMGKGLLLDTASLQKFNSCQFDFSKIDNNKPIALLPSNVIWDLAALDKQVVFSDMIDWIAQIIFWFKDHPENQLIIKPHPGELHPAIPETKERVETALTLKNITIPPNVFLLPAHVKCTVYDLLPLCAVGLVYTTTVGIEMAARGIPVITAARAPYRGFGFTHDPTSREDYFAIMENCLKSKGKIMNQIENAYKYILFYQFHYYSKIDIMDYKIGKPLILKIKSICDLKPGKNKYLDYFIDSIIEGKPIVSENRWPPES